MVRNNLKIISGKLHRLMLWVHIIEQIFIEFLAQARTMQNTREKQHIHYFFTVGDYTHDAGFVRLFSEFISGKILTYGQWMLPWSTRSLQNEGFVTDLKSEKVTDFGHQLRKKWGSLKSDWFYFNFLELFCLYLLETAHWKNIAEVLNPIGRLATFLANLDLVVYAS